MLLVAFGAGLVVAQALHLSRKQLANLAWLETLERKASDTDAPNLFYEKPIRSNMRWICRLRPWVNVTSNHGFSAVRTSRMDSGRARRPSSRIPWRSLWIASSGGNPLTLTA